MSTYKPGGESRSYHRLSRIERAKVIEEINRLFREKTGVTRKLHPLSRADRALRHKWLRIRDDIINQREIEEDMEFRREMFMDDVPGIVAEDMRNHGWQQGAELMETWLERPPAIAPIYSAPVTHVIKMNWVLKFPESKSVYERIIKDRIWANPASQKRIADLLQKSPLKAGQKFGDLSKPVTEVDKQWVNARPVKSRHWEISAALGAFELQVGVSGTILANADLKSELKIEKIGVYVKDSYDFERKQFLGVWGYRDQPVNNIDFRNWRVKNNAGGDFRVFSDVKQIRLSKPDIVKV